MPSVRLSTEHGSTTLLEPASVGPVNRKWWPVLDDNDVCRYCLYEYADCTCEEANE